MTRHEVVIAGAGPVGMVAALRLAQAGVSVLILEAGDDLAMDSKASTFHIPSLELLDTLGIGETMHEQGLRAPVFQQRERHGGVLAELDLTVLGDETRFPWRLQLEQNKLTRIIRPIVESMDNVELRFGVRAATAEDHGDHAVLMVDGSDEGIETEWLIGCDGANSMVRQGLGFGFDGVTFPERFLVDVHLARVPRLDPGPRARGVHQRPRRVVRAAAYAGPLARAHADPGGRAGRRGGERRAHPAASARPRARSTTTSRSCSTASTRCTSASRRPSARTACCSPATAPT